MRRLCAHPAKLTSSIDKLVKGATKPKQALPKSKYVDPLIAATRQRDGDLQDVLRSIKYRLTDSNSTVRTRVDVRGHCANANQVVFKTLTLLHMLIQSGSATSILSYLAQDPSALRLRDVASNGLHEYTYIKTLSRYAAYLDCRIYGFKELGYDIVRISSGHRQDHRLRRLSVSNGLLRETAVVQRMNKAVLECSFFAEDMQDELTNSALQMTLRDLLAIYMAQNEGVINILEHYFEMPRPQAERALELYKRFALQTERVVAFLDASRRSSYAMRSMIPTLKHAPLSLAGSLEEYLRDPNFEKNRQDYIRKRRNGTSPRAASPSPARAAEPAPEKPRGEAPGDKKSEEPKERATPNAPAAEAIPAPARGNQALQDFFEALEGPTTSPYDAVYSSYMGINPQQDPFGLTRQMTGSAPWMPLGMAPQPTGFNPFQQQQVPPVPPMPPQFMQPQPTGFNPFQGAPGQPVGAFAPQPTGAAWTTPFDSIFNSLPDGVPPAPPGERKQPEAPAQQPQAQAQGVQARSISFSEPQRSAPAGKAPALKPQKTGSQNPFSIPSDFEEPPPEPAPMPKGPTLNELAMSAWLGPQALQQAPQSPQQTQQAPQAAQAQQTQPAQQTQQSAASPPRLVPQMTSMGSVASEFVRPRQSEPAKPDDMAGATAAFGQMHVGDQATQQTPLQGTGQMQAQPQSPFQSQVQPFGTPGQSHSQTPFAPQPTGNIKPFKPESEFGNSLANDPRFAQKFGAGLENDSPFPRADTGPSAAATGASASVNPWAQPPSSAGPTRQDSFGPGASAFGRGLSSPGTLGSQPTGLGSALGSNPGFSGRLGSTPTGAGGPSAGLGSHANVGTPGVGTGLGSQLTGVGSPAGPGGIGARNTSVPGLGGVGTGNASTPGLGGDGTGNASTPGLGGIGAGNASTPGLGSHASGSAPLGLGLGSRPSLPDVTNSALGPNSGQSAFQHRPSLPTHLGSSAFGTNATGLGSGAGAHQTGLGSGLGSNPTGLGIGSGSQPAGLGSGLGTQPTGIGSRLGTNPTGAGAGAFGQSTTGLGSVGPNPTGVNSGLGAQPTGAFSPGAGRPTGLGQGPGASQSSLGLSTMPGSFPGGVDPASRSAGGQPGSHPFSMGGQPQAPGAFGSSGGQPGQQPLLQL